MDYQTSRPIVFAALSKRNFYFREHIVKYILEKGYTPTCAFMMFSYFLLDTVNRKALIRANNDLIRRCDELWVFGDISNGVAQEIKLAKKMKRKVRYFSVSQSPSRIIEIKESEVKREKL